MLKRPVIIKVARDYETAIHEIGSGQVHMAYLDPSAYCEARYKYKVVPLAKAVMNNVFDIQECHNHKDKLWH